MKYEIASQSKVAISIAPAVQKANTTGNAVDVSGALEASVIITVGAYVDTTFSFKLVESDDDSNYTDVASSDIYGTPISVATTNDAAQTGIIGYKGYKKYIKVVATKGGTASTGNLISAVVVLNGCRHCPTE